jgi:chromosome segregation ATPase
MAREFRFYKISEANTEIARLDSKVADLEAKLTSAASTDPELAEQADSIRKDRDSIKAENDSLKAQISTLTQERDSARAEAVKAKTDAEAHCKEFDEKVKTAAARGAVTITAAQGQPPIAQTPAATPAAEPAKPILTGLAKVQASIRKELAAQGIEETKLSALKK